MERHPYPGNVKAITQEQVGQLLGELRASAPRIVHLAVWTQYEIAGRVREAVHLTAKDLDGDYLNVRRLKKSNPSRIRISAELRQELIVLMVDARIARRGNLYLFQGGATCHLGKLPCAGGHVGVDVVFRYVQAAGRAIGLDPGLCKTHVLRHSAITHAAELCQGEPINVTLGRLRAFSGHKNLSHLLGYLSDTRDQAEFQRRKAEAFGATAKA